MKSTDAVSETWLVHVLAVLLSSFVTRANSPKNWFSLVLYLPNGPGPVFVISISCVEITYARAHGRLKAWLT